jgi:hypothetical protein
MKYRAHCSKAAAMEDAAKNAHTMPTLNDVAYKTPEKRPGNISLRLENASDDKIASIIGYMHGHKNTQLATLSSSAAGMGALKNMKKKLDLAGDELLRMEDESGTPLSAGQTAKVDLYFRESQNIEKALQTANNKPAVSIRPEANDNHHCMT